MQRRSRRLKQIYQTLSPDKIYSVEEAVKVLQGCAKAKFDESVEVSLKTGVDPKKSDQQVRGTVSLPHGTGKNIRVIVVAKGEKVKQALDAGADVAGGDEILEKIKGGWTDFDVLITTPEMMREIGKLGKILGPRGLMPTPKSGTVTLDVAKAVQESKAGKIEYKVDKSGVINNLVAKISFPAEAIVENVHTILSAIVRSKPPTAKGQYLKTLYLSTTMGPGLKIDVNTISQG